jgi:tetratricopeptide (TPR) repeat protein
MQFYPSGYRIAGRYEVAGRPLLGGMGIVYLCFDHQEQRPVALKTFRSEFLSDRSARDRFLQEGETWVRLGKHPHIVQAYTVERIGDGREVYLVLELVAKEEGRRDASLRAWITSGQPLPAEQALLIALQIVRGMAHAVETLPGFVHRDLKPENVLMGADRLSNAAINRVRVTDFGLVKGLRVEQVGTLVGTPLYMAPEQWDTADVTAQADIYALGCILGELLAGRPVMQGRTLDELRRAHQGGQPLAGVRAAPGAVRDLLAGCLAVEPGRRYDGWPALEAALAAAYRQAAGRPAPAVEPAGALSRAERVTAGWSYNDIGASYLDLGQAETALGYCERAHQAGQAEGEHGLEAAGLGNLGNASAALGDARRAIGYYEQALAIHRKIGDRRGEGAGLSNLGSAYGQLGDARRAIGYYEQALAIRREIGDRRGEGTGLGNLGEAYRQLGDARRAIGYHEQALAIRREIDGRRGEDADLSNLGNAYLQLGDARRAIGYYEQALVIRRETGDRMGEGATLDNLGSAYLQLGDARQAIGYFEQALAIARETGNRHGEGAALGNLGNPYRQLGDARRAIGYYEQALAIAREIGDRVGEGADLGDLGSAYGQLGDARRAIGYFEQALTIRREIGDLNGVATDSFNMARLYAQQGDRQRALPLAREAARLCAQMGYTAHAQEAQQLVAELEGGGSPGARPNSAEILGQFAPVITVAVAAARGDRDARGQLEGAFDVLTQNGWQIADPIRRIWAGGRNDAALTAGLDDGDSLIVREILRQL